MCKIYSVDLNYEQTFHDTLACPRSIKSFIQRFSIKRTKDLVSSDPLNLVACLTHFFLFNNAITPKSHKLKILF